MFFCLFDPTYSMGICTFIDQSHIFKGLGLIRPIFLPPAWLEIRHLILEFFLSLFLMLNEWLSMFNRVYKHTIFQWLKKMMSNFGNLQILSVSAILTQNYCLSFEMRLWSKSVKMFLSHVGGKLWRYKNIKINSLENGIFPKFVVFGRFSPSIKLKIDEMVNI